MTAPATPHTPPPAWTKAISPARDRLQSRILVWTVAPLISLGCAQLVHLGLNNTASQLLLAKDLGVSTVFALVAWALRATTAGAALFGGMICLLLALWTGSILESPLHSALFPLLAVFLLTFLTTRAGRKRKTERGLAESRKGRRASQIIANLGVAALLSNPVGDRAITWLTQNPNISDINSFRIMCIAVVAALAEATADTVSSELGQAFGGRPFLLTTFRRVEPGIDGAISLTGTLAGVVAAALVAAAGTWSMHLDHTGFWIALTAATAGLLFDSVLGATIERKGWLGNDLVNFTSTAFAGAVSLLAIRFGLT